MFNKTQKSTSSLDTAQGAHTITILEKQNRMSTIRNNWMKMIYGNKSSI